MQRGRFGGNARKRKAKLTDATFNAMIGVAPPLDALSGVGIAETFDEILEADVLGDVTIGIDNAVLEPLVAQLPGFRAQDHFFGYATCGTCRNEQVYYVHRTTLARGYTFRCRVCQHELTVSLQP